MPIRNEIWSRSSIQWTTVAIENSYACVPELTLFKQRLSEYILIPHFFLLFKTNRACTYTHSLTDLDFAVMKDYKNDSSSQKSVYIRIPRVWESGPQEPQDQGHKASLGEIVRPQLKQHTMARQSEIQRTSDRSWTFCYPSLSCSVFYVDWPLPSSDSTFSLAVMEHSYMHCYL